MAMNQVSAAEYTAMLHQLMPPGPAFDDEDALLAALGQVMANVHNRLLQILSEADPRQTNELLAVWEEDLGLPDECDEAFAGQLTFTQRRNTVVRKERALGGQTVAFYKSLLAEMGYPDANVYGHSAAGERHQFTVELPGTIKVSPVRVSDRVNTRIRYWGNDAVYCEINRAKQAHTEALFIYSGGNAWTDLMNQTP